MKKSLLLKILTVVTVVSLSLFIGTACDNEEEHVHSYTEVVTAPTCTERGFTTFTCECGNSYTGSFVDATGHTYTDVVTPPTCTERGFTTHGCACGESLVDSYVNALGHDFKNYVYNNDATYDADGTKTAVCDREGCEVEDTIPAIGTKLTGSFAFKTLTVNDKAVNGVLANAVTTFSLVDEIELVGNYTFKVFSDEEKTNEVTELTLNLVEGNNVYYVVSYLKGVEKDTYTLTIRRRPMYAVTFDTLGGSTIDAITVEEGQKATAPIIAPTKQGYTFAGWNFDFNSDITSTIVITANAWTPNANTAYKVEYYLENIENEEYTLKADATENLTGTTDAEVSAVIKSFTGFTAEESEVKGNVKADGSLVLVVKYQRNEYDVTFVEDEYYVSGNLEQKVKYQGSAVAPIYERVGYALSFDKDFSNVTDTLEVSPVWTANGGIAYKVEYYLENIENEEYTLKADATENLTGATDAEVSAVIKSFTGFTAEESEVKGNVKADGSLVLVVKYQRNEYTVTFDGNGGTLVSGDLEQKVKYEGEAVAPIFERIEGEVVYTFTGWDKEIDYVTDTFTVKANWADNNMYVKYVYNSQELTKKVAKVGGEYDVFSSDATILEKVNEIESANAGYHVEWFIGEDKFTSLEFATENDIAEVIIEAKLVANTAKLTLIVWGPENDITIGSINGEYSVTVDIKNGDKITDVVSVEEYKGYQLVKFVDTAWYDGVASAPDASTIVSDGVITVSENNAEITLYAYFYNFIIS